MENLMNQNAAEVVTTVANTNKKAMAKEEKWRKDLRQKYGSWTLKETLENPQQAIIWIDNLLKDHEQQVENLKKLRKEKLKELFADLSDEDKATLGK